jgi:hypothetical protein
MGHDDLDEFNNSNVLRIIWETFADYARSAAARSSSQYFSLMGEDSVCSHVNSIRSDPS